MDGPYTGLTVIQSGQPYSVVDYSGAVGSIFYGVNDGITNPIVPLNTTARRSKPSLERRGQAALLRSMPACFGLPLLSPGALDGAIPSNDPYETELHRSWPAQYFRQPWQRRADISLVKMTQITERIP